MYNNNNNNNNQKNKHNNNDHDNVNCDQMDTVISMDWKLGESKNVQLSVWSCLMRWFAIANWGFKTCKEM